MVFLSIALLASCQKTSKEEEKVRESTWQIKNTSQWDNLEGLINVESIIYDEANEVFYITSGKEYRPNFEGFISKISKEGKLLELKWVKWLNRPTGMAIKDSVLYVADISALVAVNTNDGTVLEKYLAPMVDSGLNDVAINEKGEVYVTASFIHGVFKLQGDSLALFIKDEKHLQWANGILADNQQLYVAGLNFCTIDITSKDVKPFPIAPTIKDFDGLIADGSGGWFLTTVENNGLYHVSAEKEVDALMEADAYFGDLAFEPTQNTLYIPRGNESGKYFISVLGLEKRSTQ